MVFLPFVSDVWRRAPFRGQAPLPGRVGSGNQREAQAKPFGLASINCMPSSKLVVKSYCYSQGFKNTPTCKGGQPLRSNCDWLDALDDTILENGKPEMSLFSNCTIQKSVISPSEAPCKFGTGCHLGKKRAHSCWRLYLHNP